MSPPPAGSDGRRPQAAAPDLRDDGLTAALIRFCRALRDRGVAASLAESVDAARALDAIDVSEREEVYLALRTVLASEPGDFVIFDELFEQMWPPTEAASRARSTSPVAARASSPRQPDDATHGSPAAAAFERWARATEGDVEGSASLRLASSLEARGGHDFRTFDDRDLREVARVARRLARQLAARPSRRWRPAARGTRLHLRRTAREALRTGGHIARLIFRERRLRRTRLVVLCDVSGSMDVYARLLLQFLYAMQHSFARVETFAFATRLSRITDQLTDRQYRAAVTRVGRDVRDWSGGTRIGASLATFVADWFRLVDRRTIVIVLSDGWDTGEPAELAHALAAIRRRAARVIWLNPLLGNPDYRPLTRGMAAALPHVDVFAPAHDLASLEALVHHLAL